MSDLWNEVRAARLPASGLAALAALRNRDDVRIAIEADSAWVRWSAANPEVVRSLLPAAGVVFFVPQGKEWYRFQHRLPSAESPPIWEGDLLVSVIVPATFEPLAPQLGRMEPIRVKAIRGGVAQVATALICRLQDLEAWADRATTKEIGSVRAARTGQRTILLGSQLPTIPDSTRYWGTDLLVPLGFRPDPDLPPATLREAIGAEADELALLHEGGAERIPRAAFQPLTRASIRRALWEGGAA